MSLFVSSCLSISLMFFSLFFLLTGTGLAALNSQWLPPYQLPQQAQQTSNHREEAFSCSYSSPPLSTRELQGWGVGSFLGCSLGSINTVLAANGGCLSLSCLLWDTT